MGAPVLGVFGVGGGIYTPPTALPIVGGVDGGRRAKWSEKQKLPDGQTCAAGTCPYSHQGVCFRDPRVAVELPPFFKESSRLDIVKYRLENAKKLGVTPKPCTILRNDPAPRARRTQRRGARTRARTALRREVPGSAKPEPEEALAVDTSHRPTDGGCLLRRPWGRRPFRMRAVLQRHGLSRRDDYIRSIRASTKWSMEWPNDPTAHFKRASAHGRLLQARLPPSYWWFAMTDALEVDSFIPFVESPSETPYSRFHGSPPTVTHIRAFGCLAYPLLFHPITKMAERATRGIHLGRAVDQSAYIVQDISTGRLSVTPHVRFVESSFPGVPRARGVLFFSSLSHKKVDSVELHNMHKRCEDEDEDKKHARVE